MPSQKRTVARHYTEMPLRPAPMARSEARQARLLPSLADLISIEMSFVLFLFAGRYKHLPALQGFPVDFTVLFFVATFCLLVGALVSRKLKAPSPDFPLLSMLLFSALAAASLFWSSVDQLNVDKLVRFLLFTSTSFFVAQ